MKNKFLLNTSMLVLVIIIINLLIMQSGHTRIDLTKQKKYTLSKTTKQILQEIDD